MLKRCFQVSADNKTFPEIGRQIADVNEKAGVEIGKIYKDLDDASKPGEISKINAIGDNETEMDSLKKSFIDNHTAAAKDGTNKADIVNKQTELFDNVINGKYSRDDFVNEKIKSIFSRQIWKRSN